MSRENVGIVRQSIAIGESRRRRFDEWVGLHFPRAVTQLSRAVFRLPTRSPLRQALLKRAARFGLEAHNRGDLEAAFMLWHEDCESTFPDQMGGLGSASGTRGRADRVAFHRRFFAEWDGLRYEPSELVDLGDGRLLVLGRMKGRGLSSGAAFDHEWALVTTNSGGRVIREQVFLDHAQALEAVGLRD